MNNPELNIVDELDKKLKAKPGTITPNELFEIQQITEELQNHYRMLLNYIAQVNTVDEAVTLRAIDILKKARQSTGSKINHVITPPTQNKIRKDNRGGKRDNSNEKPFVEIVKPIQDLPLETARSLHGNNETVLRYTLPDVIKDLIEESKRSQITEFHHSYQEINQRIIQAIGAQSEARDYFNTRLRAHEMCIFILSRNSKKDVRVSGHKLSFGDSGITFTYTKREKQLPRRR
jgi:hypothetical protein